MVKAELPDTRPKLSPAEFHAIVGEINSGDLARLDEFRAALADFPGFVEGSGCPARALTDRLIKRYSKNAGVQEAARRKLRSLRRELHGPNPTPLERLLVERAILCWFEANTYDAINEASPKAALPVRRFLLQKSESAHRRFLSAVRTLATVRKLALPAVQINVGANQVNMTGG